MMMPRPRHACGKDEEKPLSGALCYNGGDGTVDGEKGCTVVMEGWWRDDGLALEEIWREVLLELL